MAASRYLHGEPEVRDMGGASSIKKTKIAGVAGSGHTAQTPWTGPFRSSQYAPPLGIILSQKATLLEP